MFENHGSAYLRIRWECIFEDPVGAGECIFVNDVIGVFLTGSATSEREKGHHEDVGVIGRLRRELSGYDFHVNLSSPRRVRIRVGVHMQ